MSPSNSKRFRLRNLSLATVLVSMAVTTVGQQWTRVTFEKLFPEPAMGWSASAMQIQELGTSTNQAEKMFNLAGAINGKGQIAESVRYRLTREYRSGARLISVAIDSENLGLETVVLMLHGYMIDETGKQVPLAGDNKAVRDEMLKGGMQTLKIKDHLAVRGTYGSHTLLAVLVGNRGGISLECPYANCLGDADALMNGVDLQSVDSFARFRHVKAK